MQTELELPVWNQTERIILQKNGSAIEARNKSWEKNNHIPSWVEIDNVDLDQFFTRPEIALKCWKSFCKYIKHFL